jgi:hypothetical protein
MRWIGIVGLLGLAACVGEPATGSPVRDLWAGQDGSVLSAAEVSGAYQHCAARFSLMARAEMTPYFAEPSGYVHFYENNWNAPAYNHLSSAEISACMHADGYSRWIPPTEGSGSSTR